MRDEPAACVADRAVGGDPGKRGGSPPVTMKARATEYASGIMASAVRAQAVPGPAGLVRRVWRSYREASQAIQAIFNDYTTLIQPLSLDESLSRCEQ